MVGVSSVCVRTYIPMYWLQHLNTSCVGVGIFSCIHLL